MFNWLDSQLKLIEVLKKHQNTSLVVLDYYLNNCICVILVFSIELVKIQ